MSDVIAAAVAKLNEKIGTGFAGTARFDVTGEGSIVIDEAGARESDDAADVTLSADTDTFREMIEGDLNPTTAFMSGRLTIDGDMGTAMKLASALA